MPSTVLTSGVSAGAQCAVSEHCIWQQVTLGLMGDHCSGQPQTSIAYWTVNWTANGEQPGGVEAAGDS